MWMTFVVDPKNWNKLAKGTTIRRHKYKKLKKVGIKSLKSSHQHIVSQKQDVNYQSFLDH